MSFEITDVTALEILDSRGRPTLQTTVTLSDGTTAVAGVPSGASTGTREAVELRDGDTTRFAGGGVLTAVGIVNGGAHAPNALDFQEFMISPLGAPNVTEAVRAGAEVYAALRKRLSAAGHATGLGDEGGFAPELAEPEEVLEVIVAAITDAGYTPGRSGIAIALDPAASEFHKDGSYHVNGKQLSSHDMVERYAAMIERYPIWSIEDGLGESDHDGWKELTTRLGAQIQLVGDDNFCTNPAIITAAIADGIGNSALIKLNQIGTVSETLEAMAICQRAGYTQMISHRSGETPDPFIADLAVGTGCGQLKTGAPARGERVAKYNRLMEISAHHPDLAYGLV